MFARILLIGLVRLIFKVVAKVQYVGLENLKVSGPTIVVANHLGRLDAPLILSLNEFTQHPNLVVVVAEKYKKYWIYRWAVDVLNFLWLDRFNSDVSALREVIRRIEADGLMVISPEGTRSAEEALIEAKQGAAYLAVKTKATLIPVAVTGTEDRRVRARLRSFKRADITLRIGSPFHLSEFTGSSKSRSLKLEIATDEIMSHIAALLPESYRGHYRENPFLIRLLAETDERNDQ